MERGRMKNLEFFGPNEKCAGLFCIDILVFKKNIVFHFLVRKPHRRWGYENLWWNGPFKYIGLGQLLLFAIMDEQ